MYCGYIVRRDQQLPVFSLGPAPYKARKLKFGILFCSHLCVLASDIKVCPLGAVWGNQELPLFILGLPSYLRN